MPTHRKAQRAEALPLVLTKAQVELLITAWSDQLTEDKDRVGALFLTAAPPWVKLKAARQYKKSVDNFHRFVKAPAKDNFRPF